MTTATVREISAMESMLAQIVDAAGFKLGEQYTAEEVVRRLIDQGRSSAADDKAYLEAKIAELMRERQRLHEAIMQAREHLADVPVDASAALRARYAYNILSRVLGLDGAGADRDDFEAQRRLAQQSAERDE